MTTLEVAHWNEPMHGMLDEVAAATPGMRWPVLRHAVYVGQMTHPIWPHLQLVTWKLGDGTWSHDALDARQDIGRIAPSSAAERIDRLRLAILGAHGGPRPADHKGWVAALERDRPGTDAAAVQEENDRLHKLVDDLRQADSREVAELKVQRDKVLALCDEAEQPCRFPHTGVCTHEENPLTSGAVREIYTASAKAIGEVPDA